MRVLVVGARGMLGRDTTAAVAARGHSVRGLSRAELDITRPADVEHASLRRRRGETGQPVSRRLPAPVKMVGGGDVVARQPGVEEGVA